MSLRTWRGIRTPKYEQPARVASVVMTSSSSHRARGEAERDPTLDEEEEDDDRDRDQRRGRHHRAPVDATDAPAEEVRQPERDRLLRVVVQDDAREDVLVPGRDEGENGRRYKAGRDERQQDAEEGAETGRAVDHRRLLELLWDADQEAAQRPDRERQSEREVDENHAGQRVHLAVAAEQHVERDDQSDRRPKGARGGGDGRRLDPSRRLP